VFGAVAVVSAVSGANTRTTSALLDGSAHVAQNAVATIRARHPHLAPGTTLFFLDQGEPLFFWNDGQGALFRMAFNEEKIVVLHASQGELCSLDQVDKDTCIVVRVSKGIFQEVPLREVLEEVLPSENAAGHELSITPTRVVAGRDSYTLRVAGLSSAVVEIYYRLNGGPVQAFGARLEDDGEVRFKVGPETPKGTYRFVAIIGDIQGPMKFPS
jgi:hypothetical protein